MRRPKRSAAVTPDPASRLELHTTALGAPVEPEVNSSSRTWSPPTGAKEGPAAASRSS